METALLYITLIVVYAPLVALLLSPVWLFYFTLRYPNVLGPDRPCDRGLRCTSQSYN